MKNRVSDSRDQSIILVFGAIFLITLFISATSVHAQSSTQGPDIDVEIINPTDGTNTFCVAPNDTLTARLFVRPGTDSTSCTPSCGLTVDGGTAHLATAVVDVAFNSAAMSLTGSSNNAATAAVDGLLQDNTANGRIGWALAGDWTPDADTGGTLANPCDMQLLDTAGWVFEMQFAVASSASGISSLHIRRETDSPPFALSFADICGTDAFTASGGIDEIIDGAVLVSTSCTDLLFFDGFESHSTTRWSSATGGK